MKNRSRQLISKIITSALASSMLLSASSCSKKPSDEGFDGRRFNETRHISVLVDSFTEYKSDYTVNTSKTAEFIRENALKDLNIDVTFIESEKLNFENGVSPDIAVYNNYNIITTYYRMNAVVNLAPYLNQYSDSMQDLKGVLGDVGICPGNKEPQEVWYLTPSQLVPNQTITFIRKDWLDKLNLSAPKTRDEFLKCIQAFKANSEKLLGKDADKMIPFFVDSEPNISAKPFFDSFLDTSIDDMSFYNHGYCRVAQKGYKEGIKTLNDWYLKGLLPEDFRRIRPGTKESYEPIENGFVGAFCAKADYLYINGENSHINALHKAAGDDADYIAVNTFEDANGKYNYWNEDFLYESIDKIFIPATCKDPLACLVYLNWISNSDNMNAIMNINRGDDSLDPFTSDRYLITKRGMNSKIDPAAEPAINTARDVNYIDRLNKCVRYWPTAFEFTYAEEDIARLYPGSPARFVSNVVISPEGKFDECFQEQFEIYKKCGANTLFKIRYEEWDKVITHGNTEPW